MERKFRLADFIRLNWDKYAEHPTEPIRPEQYKAVNAIRVCRTAALGVDTYVCPECGEVSEIYHSCKNRFCPTCSWRDTMLWAERVKKQMLNIPHRHVVMTLPHLLNPLIKRNGKELLNVLMKTSAETMKDWIENKYSLKAGVISVLHTFGEKKNYHVHVHMIVTWGGIHKSTGELVEIQSPYVRVSFLQKKFREKFRERLNFMYKYGILKHDFRNDDEFADFKRSMYQSCWTINLEPPMKIPSQVICYIGRYSKRACLSEYKITAIEGEYISFRYKDFDLSVQINGAFGHKIYNGTSLTYMNMGIFPDYNVMKGAPQVNIKDQTATDYWLERGDYVNFDYVTAGWNVPLRGTKRYVQNLRLTFTVNNLATITGYSGLSPMINSATVNGTLGLDDKRNYPLARTYTLGLSINF